MSKELDYLDVILKTKPLTLNNRMIIECIKEKIQRLEAIDNSNPSEALECLDKIVDKGRINDGSCCHWRECLSKNKCNFNNDNLMCPDYTKANTIKQALLKAQEQEKVIIELCEYCGMDNLYPYDNLEKIEITFKDKFDNYQRQRIESLGRLNKQEKVLDIIKKKDVDIQRLMKCINVATYNNGLPKNQQLTKEEFNLLRSVLGE